MSGTGTFTFNDEAVYSRIANVVGPVTHILLPTEEVLMCDPTAGAIAVTLPAAPKIGQQVIIKDKTGTSAINAITINASGGILIEQLVGVDATPFLLNVNHGDVTLIYSGTNWAIL